MTPGRWERGNPPKPIYLFEKGDKVIATDVLNQTFEGEIMFSTVSGSIYTNVLANNKKRMCKVTEVRKI